LYLIQPKRIGSSSYISTGKNSSQNPLVIFSVKERCGALAKALGVFEVRISTLKIKKTYLEYFLTNF
jgi:hypothetical protein